MLTNTLRPQRQFRPALRPGPGSRAREDRCRRAGRSRHGGASGQRPPPPRVPAGRRLSRRSGRFDKTCSDEDRSTSASAWISRWQNSPSSWLIFSTPRARLSSMPRNQTEHRASFSTSPTPLGWCLRIDLDARPTRGTEPPAPSSIDRNTFAVGSLPISNLISRLRPPQPGRHVQLARISHARGLREATNGMVRAKRVVAMV